MRITTYKAEFDGNRHNVLVKENSCNYPANSLSNPVVITEMLNDVFHLNKQAEEYLYMIAVDIKHKPLGVFQISHGTVNAVLCTPREIFIRALLCGASGIVLAHNHPSGDITPSKEDIAVYRRIDQTGELIGIELLDNIIVGDGYYSFKANGIR